MSIEVAPAGVAMKYNGFTFPTNIRTKVSEEPVQSGDNRQVKYSKLTISVSGFITQIEADALGLAGTLDATMKHIRRKLQVNGKNLVYVNKGYGDDLDINNAGGGGVRDVAFGPKPGKLAWWPMGGAGAGCYGAGFSWEVTTFIAECARFVIAPGVFVEVSFTVTYDTDEAGLVTIVHAGTAQIPMSLRANNTIERTVDDEIGRIIQPVPVGFLRRMSRTLSTDRATCTFTITDKQVEIPYPDDVVFIDMKYRVKQQAKMIPNWECAFSATIRLSPTAEKEIAWRRFHNIVAQRIALIRIELANAADRFAEDAVPNILPGIVEAEEDLFKNESRFSATFRIVGIPMRRILKASGLWRPLIAAVPPMSRPWDAEIWTTSLRGNAQSLRGIVNAKFNVNTEVIIDVCSGRTATPAANGTSVPLGSDRSAIIAANLSLSEGVTDSDFDGDEPSRFMDVDSKIDPESSWVAWSCVPRLITDHNQIRHKPLAGVVRTRAPKVDFFDDADKTIGDSGTYDAGWTATVPDIIQRTASPSVILQLRGFGVRVGHRVNPPKLLTFGGQPAILRHEDLSESQLGISGDVSAYRTDWLLEYILPNAPTSFDLPAHPAFGTDGEKGPTP